jgi:HEAT repeat protein
MNMSTKLRTQLLVASVALAAVTGFASTATAGRGGSAAKIQNAINSTSQDAIIAELERAERLVCDACIAPVLALLEDDRYEVREVAAWWFARRPVMKVALAEQSTADLEGSDSTRARNAADILGTFRHPSAIPALSAAVVRTDLSAEARQHAARALGRIGHPDGSPALESALADADADVRFEALNAWIGIRGQNTAVAAVDLVSDGDARVRAKAAAVVGEMREAAGRAALEQQLANDTEPTVRRNAAWALGQIGDSRSRAVLETAQNDESSLVRMTAKAAIYKLN